MRLPDPDASRVVLFGTAQYSDPEFWELKQVSDNLSALRDLLTQPGRGGFRPNHCHVLSDPENVQDLDRHIFDIAREAEDVLLIYYAGHGMVDIGDRQLYLCLRNTEPSLLVYSALALRRIKLAFLASPAKVKILILDCCFSGRAGSEVMMSSGSALLKQEIEVQGVYTLSSSPAYEASVAEPDAKHTAFTGALLSLLENGAPGGPGVLTLVSLYPHLRNILTSRSYPEPQQWMHSTAGEIVLVGNSAAVVPDPGSQVAVTTPQLRYTTEAGSGSGAGSDDAGESGFQPRRVGAALGLASPSGGDASQAVADHELRLRELVELARQADQPAKSGVDPGTVVTELRKIVTEMIPLTWPEHSEVLAARDLLAFWLGRTGNSKEAARMYHRLADARERSLGSDHEAVMATRHNEAHWTGGAGDAVSAVALFERVVADRRRVLGADHADTLLSVEGLAYWTGEAGDAAAAAELYRELADMQEWQHGDMNEAVLQTRYYLAHWIGNAGDTAEAARIYEDLAVSWAAKPGEDCMTNSIACREKGVYWTQRGHHGDQ